MGCQRPDADWEWGIFNIVWKHVLFFHYRGENLVQSWYAQNIKQQHWNTLGFVSAFFVCTCVDVSISLDVALYIGIDVYLNWKHNIYTYDMYSYDACFSKVCWVYCSCKAHSISIFWHGKLQAFSWHMEMSQVQELAPRWLMLFCRRGTPCGSLYHRSPNYGYNINTMPFGIRTPVAIYQQPNWSSKWGYNLTVYRQTLFNWTHVLAWWQPTWLSCTICQCGENFPESDSASPWGQIDMGGPKCRL